MCDESASPQRLVQYNVMSSLHYYLADSAYPFNI